MTCCKHPDQPAVVSCVECGKGICQQCLNELPDSYRFICALCVARNIRKKVVFTGLKSLKSPVLWVCLCVLISAVAYAMGVGNPRLSTLMKRDRKWSWYSQDVGKLYLAKASRENQRAAALRELDKPEEAVVWTQRACHSFQQVADYWSSTPVHGYLLAAVAHQYYWAGEYKKALQILKPLKFKYGDPAAVGLNYMLGLVYERLGEKKLAKARFSEAIEEQNSSYMKRLDNFINDMTGNRREAAKICMVRELCGLLISREALNIKRVEYGIEDPNGAPLYNQQTMIPKLKDLTKALKRVQPPQEKDEPLKIEKMGRNQGPEKQSGKNAGPKSGDGDGLKIEFFNQDK
jgi:tetratricopeptide (TPR) repeat protein